MKLVLERLKRLRARLVNFTEFDQNALDQLESIIEDIEQGIKQSEENEDDRL
jgi:hypothetical protein